jgi:hypothetical protein
MVSESRRDKDHRSVHSCPLLTASLCAAQTQTHWTSSASRWCNMMMMIYAPMSERVLRSSSCQAWNVLLKNWKPGRILYYVISGLYNSKNTKLRVEWFSFAFLWCICRSFRVWLCQCLLESCRKRSSVNCSKTRIKYRSSTTTVEDWALQNE